MTFQNCGDEYSSLRSDTWFEGSSLDGLDLSKSSSQPKRKENKYKSWNFQYRKLFLLIFIPIVRLVQSESRTVLTMTQ